MVSCKPEMSKIIPNDLIEGDNFGCSLAVTINGEILVIGSLNGSGTGVAYIYSWSYSSSSSSSSSSSKWKLNQKIYPSNVSNEARFSSALDIDNIGSLLVIGAWADSSSCPELDDYNCGSAFVFTNHHGQWIEKGKIVSSDISKRDLFGVSIAVTTQLIVVGASGVDSEDGKASDIGAVYLFSPDTLEQLSKVIANDFVSFGIFGSSISIQTISNHFHYIIIGSPWYPCSNSNSNTVDDMDCGQAYVLTYETKDTTTTPTITNNNNIDDSQLLSFQPTTYKLQDMDFFGASISSSSSSSSSIIQILIGSYGIDENSGAVFLFELDTNQSNEIKIKEVLKILNPSPSPSDHFSHSIDIQLNSILVGSIYHDSSAPNSGAAYLYSIPSLLSSSSSSSSSSNKPIWLYPGIKDKSPEFYAAYFGQSVSLARNLAYIGAPNVACNTGPGCGAVFIHQQSFI